MDIEAEIHDLKRRVGDLEGAVNVLAGQIGRLHPDLTTLRQQSASRFDGIDRVMDGIVKRLDQVNLQVWSLRDDFPHLVGDAIRHALGK